MHTNIRPFQDYDLACIDAIYNLSKLDELKNEAKHFQLTPLQEDHVRYPLFLESQKVVYQHYEESTTELANKKVVAYTAFFQSELRALYVHPQFRKRGIAGELLKYVIESVDESMHLQVTSSNDSAIRLYKAFGFKITATINGHYDGKQVLVNTMQRLR